MSEKINLFPGNHLQALTMLYLENQDLSNCTPEELLDLYDSTLDKITTHYRKTRPDRRRLGWNQD